MQSQSKVLDDLAKVLTNAAGAAKGMRQEMETLIRHQAERLIADFDLVTREEFEAVQAMAAKARSENEVLRKKLDKLEKDFKGGSAKAKATLPKPKKTAKKTKKSAS